jgi:hypothetical protein
LHDKKGFRRPFDSQMKCFFCGEENDIVLENHHLIPRRLNKAVFSKNAAKTEKVMENLLKEGAIYMPREGFLRKT